MDRRSLAIILGATVGVVAVAAAVGVYVSHRGSEPATRDVNEVFEQARRTVAELDKVVESLRQSAA